MTARRHTLRLHFRLGLWPVAEVATNLDPSDAGILRTRLEEMVKAQTGTLNVDLSNWTLKVHRHDGGMVVVTCSVDSAGKTVVRR